jgi:hypothetical protein
MKKHIRLFITFLSFTLLMCIHTSSIAQPGGPPPPPGGGHGGTGNEPAPGAPIGEGIFLLISLAGLYGGKKVYDIRKSMRTEE